MGFPDSSLVPVRIARWTMPRDGGNVVIAAGHRLPSPCGRRRFQETRGTIAFEMAHEPIDSRGIAVIATDNNKDTSPRTNRPLTARTLHPTPVTRALSLTAEWLDYRCDMYLLHSTWLSERKPPQLSGIHKVLLLCFRSSSDTCHLWT